MTALRSALSAEGRACLAVISLHLQVLTPVMEERSEVPAWSDKRLICNGVASALPALVTLLPQLQSARISSAWKLDDRQACMMVQSLQACPMLDTLHLATPYFEMCRPWVLQSSHLLAAVSQLKDLRVFGIGGVMSDE